MVRVSTCQKKNQYKKVVYYFWYCYNTDISKVIQFKMSLFWNAKKSSAIKTKFKICLGWHKERRERHFF